MANPNDPVTVNVRIEGLNETIFDETVEGITGGEVTTTIAPVVEGFADGRNGNEYPFAVPTFTSALAAVATGVDDRPGWGAVYNANFDDFFINQIGDEPAEPNTQFWQLALNFKRAQLGGGQLRVQTGDSVLLALVTILPTPSNGTPLRLKGPRTATVDVPFQVTVINGETREAIAGAAVGGQFTNAQGQAMITFAAAGAQTLKASYAWFVRSNALRVTVTAPAE